MSNQETLLTASTPETTVEASTAASSGTQIEITSNMAEAPAPATSEKILGKFNSQKDLEEGYKNLEKLLGEKGKLVPESVDKYEITGNLAETEIKEIKAMAHKLGLTNKQAQELVNNELAIREKMISEDKANGEKMVSELRKELGGKFDETIKEAKKAFNILADESTRKVILDNGLGSHPAIIKMFANLSEKFLKEHKTVDTTANSGAVNPNDRINEIYTKHFDLIFSGSGSERDNLLVELEGLYTKRLGVK